MVEGYCEMKKWYKVCNVSAITNRTFVTYRYLDEGAEKYNTLSSTAELCDPAQVPYMTRAMAEATLEQFKEELMSRGWKMTLS